MNNGKKHNQFDQQHEKRCLIIIKSKGTRIKYWTVYCKFIPME